MLYWVILFILGEVSDKVFPIGITSTLAVGMLVVFCVIPAVFFKKNRKLLLIGVFFFLAGVVCYSYVEEKVSLCKAEEGKILTFEGKITEVQVSEKGTFYIVKTETVDGKNVRAGFKITLEQKEEIMPGTVISASGSVKSFSEATNPAGFDEKSYQYGNGIFLSLKDVKIYSIKKPIVPVYEMLNRVKKHFLSVYAKVFDEKNASLAGAMVLGDKASLDADIKQLYQRNGIAHLIAISGLHIAMIGGVLYQILRKALGSFSIAAGIGITFIILYGIMTGLSGATCRAVLMLTVSIGADVSGRKYDTITAVSVALLFMLIKNPYQLTQVGFLLSFGAIIGIAVIYPILKQYLHKLPKWLDGLLVSVSVQLTLLPVMLYYFYEIPVYGILLNIVVVPLMSVLLPLLIFCGIIGSVFLEGGSIFAKISDIIFFVYESLCRLSEHLPFHTFCTGRPSVLWIVLYYLILVAVLLSVYKKRFRFLFVCGVMSAGLFTVFFLPSSLKICSFDVGQGDGCYIRTPNRKHILVDGGSSSKKKTGTYVLKNGMKYYGGNQIDYIFVSHMDSDHYNGIAELLNDSTVLVKNFIMPGITDKDEEYRELENMAEKKGCRIYYLKQGDTLIIDGVTFSCLNPTYKSYEDKNQGSMVLLMSYRNFDMLFTGDIDETVENEIKNQINIPVEVLKVAHHGSATASSKDFLKKVSPDNAVISVGKKNRYGHPAKEVMKCLSVYCQKIYLTKDAGAITIDTNGKKYKINQWIEK